MVSWNYFFVLMVTWRLVYQVMIPRNHSTVKWDFFTQLFSFQVQKNVFSLDVFYSEYSWILKVGKGLPSIGKFTFLVRFLLRDFVRIITWGIGRTKIKIDIFYKMSVQEHFVCVKLQKRFDFINRTNDCQNIVKYISNK